MADNSSPPGGAPKSPVPPLARTSTVKLPTPTSQQPMRRGGPGKIVVLLSSVAKPPPAGTQAMTPVPPPVPPPVPIPVAPTVETPKEAASATPAANRPPPLPAKTVTTAPPLRPVMATTRVKLPSKTGVPFLTPYRAPIPASAPATIARPTAPPPLPTAKSGAPAAEPKKPGIQLIPAIKLNPPAATTEAPDDSIFLDADTSKPEARPDGWKSLETGELAAIPGGLQSLEVFSRSRKLEGKPKDPAPTPLAVVPPLAAKAPESATGKLQPPHLPAPAAEAKAPEIATPPSVPHAPPLAVKGPEAPAEKLPAPHLPAPAAETKAPEIVAPPPVRHAPPPAIKGPEAPAEKLPAPHLPAPAAEAKALEIVAPPPIPPVAPTTPKALVVSPEKSIVPVTPPIPVESKPPQSVTTPSMPTVPLLTPKTSPSTALKKPVVEPPRAEKAPETKAAKPKSLLFGLGFLKFGKKAATTPAVPSTPISPAIAEAKPAPAPVVQPDLPIPDLKVGEKPAATTSTPVPDAPPVSKIEPAVPASVVIPAVVPPVAQPENAPAVAKSETIAPPLPSKLEAAPVVSKTDVILPPPLVKPETPLAVAKPDVAPAAAKSEIVTLPPISKPEVTPAAAKLETVTPLPVVLPDIVPAAAKSDTSLPPATPKSEVVPQPSPPGITPSPAKPDATVSAPAKSEVKLFPAKADAKAAVAAKPEVKLPAKSPEITSAAVPAAVGAMLASATATPPPALGAPSKAKSAKAPPPLTRAARAQRRHLMETILFYVLFAGTIAALIFGGLYFGRETRVEGQVIPPPGQVLSNEVWIVSDFRDLAAGIAEDLAAERTPLMQEIQERQDHVQRIQADIAAREERIRLIQDEIAATKDEINTIVKQSRDATQKIWDGPGAQLDDDYASRLNQFQRAVADRAKSLNLKYQPDDTYHSPEVWANAYRLALYDVPASVDTVKEHQWLSDQLKQWRAFEKSLDDQKEQLREQAAQIKQAPAPKIADLNTKIDDLHHRIDATTAEEEPLKTELLDAQANLAQAQSVEQTLDDKYYKQLDALPAEAVTKHIPLQTNGRFSWQEDDAFAEGETEHNYWIFSRATRSDGRQYWALHRFTVQKNKRVEMMIEPNGFISTKAILRPNLSPDEQAE